MRQICTFLLIVLLPTLLIAQVKQVVTSPKEQTVNKELEAKIDSLFASINNTNSPGVAVTVIENGKVIAKKAYGMASIEHRVPFTHQTVVKMPYSESREFISIAAVLMERDGILKLDDKVRKYFPKLPEWADGVTIWDLLNHRSGFADEWSAILLTQASMANRFDKAQFLRLLYNQPKPEVEPGKGYMYSNSDFGLLRLILEKASGKNLPDWLKQRVFDPLKMHSTGMENDPLDVIPNKAIMYQTAGDKKFKQDVIWKTSPGGDYYILTTAVDLEKWAAAHADPATEIAKAAARLLANVRTLPGKDRHYTVGYTRRDINNREAVLHEGIKGYNYLTRIPDSGLAVITLRNVSYNWFGEQHKAIVNYLLKAPAPTPPNFLTKPVSITKDELAKYEGRYLWENQVSWESYVPVRKYSDLFVADGVLKMRYSGSYVIDLIPVGKDVFYYNEGWSMQITFSHSANDALMKAEVRFDDGDPGGTLIKDTSVLWKPSKQELAAFAGKYYSKHLDFYWTLELNEEGKLIIKRPTVADTIIEPDGVNQFLIKIETYPGIPSDAWILFHKNEKGNITHFTVWDLRLMHHRFDRIGQ
jgi:CubicO group peptidase (beta-lactamase class C family)